MNLNRDELLSQLREVDEYEFEQLVADVWEQRGWETVVTTASNDRGIDVVAQKSSPFSQKHLIQAKRYSAGNKIGSRDIQQYSSLRHQENDVDAVVVVTTSSFSTPAQETANDLNVKLIDGNDLYEMIFDLNSHEFLSGYLDADRNTRRKRGGSISNLPDNFEKDKKTIKFGTTCPICGEKRSIWNGSTTNTDPILICESCGTKWTEQEEEEKDGFLSYNRWTEWKVLGKDTQKKASEWKDMSPNRDSQDR